MIGTLGSRTRDNGEGIDNKVMDGTQRAVTEENLCYHSG